MKSHTQRPVRCLLLLIALTCSARAGVTYQASGIFSPAIPVSFFTAPNQNWALSFSMSETPSVSGVTSTYFSPAFSGFTYWLNNVNLGLSPAVTFYDASLGGMFDVAFTVDNVISLFGPVMFSGSTAAPTMLTGSFVANSGVVSVGGTLYKEELAGTIVSTTPEPGTVVLAAGGVLALFLRRRRSADRD